MRTTALLAGLAAVVGVAFATEQPAAAAAATTAASAALHHGHHEHGETAMEWQEYKKLHPKEHASWAAEYNSIVSKWRHDSEEHYTKHYARDAAAAAAAAIATVTAAHEHRTHAHLSEGGAHHSRPEETHSRHSLFPWLHHSPSRPAHAGTAVVAGTPPHQHTKLAERDAELVARGTPSQNFWAAIAALRRRYPRINLPHGDQWLVIVPIH